MPFCHIRLTSRRPLPEAYPKALKTIGDHIRKSRLDAGLLQREVARIIGVHPFCIVNWEVNRTSPQLRCLPPIIRFLGYDPLPKPESLIEQLVHYRTSRGLRRRKMAKLIGVDEGTLAKWERGERQPVGRFLARIKRFISAE